MQNNKVTLSLNDIRSYLQQDPLTCYWDHRKQPVGDCVHRLAACR